MQYPLMNGQRMYRVSVPELKGGMNLYDSPEHIEDNQIAACTNLWWQNGALRTRPGLSLKWLRSIGETTHRFFDMDIGKIESSVMAPHYGRYDMRLNDGAAWMDFVRYDGTVDVAMDGTEIGGNGVDANLVYTNGSVSVPGDTYNPEFLLFTSEGKVFYRYKTKDEDRMVDISDSLYAPLVMMNGAPYTEETAVRVNGTFFEGYNMLTDAFRVSYTTDGEGIYYGLSDQALDTTKSIHFAYTHTDGSVCEWVCEGGSSSSKEKCTIGGEAVSVNVDWNRRLFYFSKTSGVYTLPRVASNNLTVTAWRKADVTTSNTIFGMTISTWFGGDRSGINGGTRLFMSGNPGHPALVHWSDINNPLYFPENNYAYIGDSSSPVTAFGKQQNILVIFKEHEMFYAEYVAGTSYTAEDVMEGRVVDVTAYAATFPITPIHDQIGCDCPGTLQLCNNHLVWANSDGKVYTLTSPNQYNQRNVQPISQMIDSALKAFSYTEWQTAHAVDYREHYLLQIADRIFLFNYGDSGFVYINSYYKQETAQRNIAWYSWDIGVGNMPWVYMMARDDQLVLIGQNETDCAYYVLDDDADHDMTNPREEGIELVTDLRKIAYTLQTKQFDFGALERRKTIASVYIWAGESTEAKVTYILEQSELPDGTSFLPVAGVSRKTPNISRERTFGMRIDGEGHVALSGISINYKLMGGVR